MCVTLLHHARGLSMTFSQLLSMGALGMATMTHAQMALQTPASAAPGSVANLRYESAFADYRPFSEVDLMSWKQANGDAAAQGGHAGHVAGHPARAPAPAAAAPTSKPPVDRPPAQPNHSRHQH